MNWPKGEHRQRILLAGIFLLRHNLSGEVRRETAQRSQTTPAAKSRGLLLHLKLGVALAQS
jgi:hypothetical protein